MDAYIAEALPDQVVKAIGNTIAHSLWQGVILAAITGLIIVFTRRSSPVVRYNLLITVLALFAASAVYTVVHYLLQNTTAFPVSLHRMPGFGNIHLPAGNTPDAPFKDAVIAFIDMHSNSIVLIWFLVVCIRSLQLITGLYGVYRLRRRSVNPVSEAWQTRIKELALKLGIRKMVSIAESGMATVPMVIGSLKPLILIPAGLLTSLPSEEIEAVLIHELAHIRRRDYLVNMLQTFMEIVFFFNPAVLWISSLIKAERENCCDDIAVSQTSSKAGYIRALVSCQEYQLSVPTYVMALNGHDNNHLLLRVKRIISGNTGNPLNLKEKSILVICLIAAGVFTATFSNQGKIIKHVSSTGTAHSANLVSNKKTVSSVTKTVIEVKELTEKSSFNQDKIGTDYQKADSAQFEHLQYQIDALSKQMEKEEAIAVRDSIRHSRELDKLTAELIHEGVINSHYVNLSFKLSMKEFIVNGIKQPDNVFKRFRDKYAMGKGPADDWSWYYNYETSLETITTG